MYWVQTFVNQKCNECDVTWKVMSVVDNYVLREDPAINFVNSVWFINCTWFYFSPWIGRYKYLLVMYALCYVLFVWILVKKFLSCAYVREYVKNMLIFRLKYFIITLQMWATLSFEYVMPLYVLKVCRNSFNWFVKLLKFPIVMEGT